MIGIQLLFKEVLHNWYLIFKYKWWIRWVQYPSKHGVELFEARKQDAPYYNEQSGVTSDLNLRRSDLIPKK